MFRDAGAQVIGVSSDSAESHQKFAGKHALPFILLADRDGVVASRYGVKKTLGLLPGRVTFVVDRGGVVRMVFSSQLRAGQHVTKALDAVKALV